LGRPGTFRITTFQLPEALHTPDDEKAVGLLRRYFGEPYLSPGCAEGAYFDTWTPDTDPFRFTADDLIAIKFLSVDVPTTAVRELLRDRADEFTKLLVELGPDRDLAYEHGPLDDEWPGCRLMLELRKIRGVGRTIASKLLARKRPRLLPIWDSVVGAVTETTSEQWEPLRTALCENEHALHHWLLRLRDQLNLPKKVSALRILDVIAWLEGKDRGL